MPLLAEEGSCIVPLHAEGCCIVPLLAEGCSSQPLRCTCRKPQLPPQQRLRGSPGHAALGILLTHALLLQPEIDHNKVLVVHNASSCTHPANYYHLMKTIVYPYWAADPPEHRLSKKNYKPVDHHTAWVPEDSLAFKVGHLARAQMQRCLAYSSNTMACCSVCTALPGSLPGVAKESVALRTLDMPACTET